MKKYLVNAKERNSWYMCSFSFLWWPGQNWATVLIFIVCWKGSTVFDRGCYFQVHSSLKLGMSIDRAYSTALHTWASWVNAHISPNKTRVFFRTFEPSHWRYLLKSFCLVLKLQFTKKSVNTKLNICHKILVSFSDSKVHILHLKL